MSNTLVQQYEIDLTALNQAGVPIRLEDGRGSWLWPISLRRRNQRQIRRYQDRWKVAQANQAELTELPFPLDSIEGISDRYLAGLGCFAKTGSMAIVIEALASDGLVRQQVNRSVRWTRFYLGFVILVMLSCLFYFYQMILPELFSLRQQTLGGSPIPADGANSLFWPQLIFGAATGICLLMFVALLAGGDRWLVFRFGGTRSMDDALMGTAARAIGELIMAGVDRSLAISTAIQLTQLSPSLAEKLNRSARGLSAPLDWVDLARF